MRRCYECEKYVKIDSERGKCGDVLVLGKNIACLKFQKRKES
jgi:hypothetical protein